MSNLNEKEQLPQMRHQESYTGEGVINKLGSFSNIFIFSFVQKQLRSASQRLVNT